MAEFISLVVCTIGRREPLARLLRSLKEQTSSAFEVIVVDQNEGDELVALVRSFDEWLRIYHLRSARGLSRARNVGLRQAGGWIVGFPDDDCWYPKGAIERVASFFRHATAAVLTGRTLDRHGTDSVSNHRPESGPIDRYNVFASGNSSALFARSEVVQAVGGFDEELGVGASTPFQSGEETDFILKCLHAGHAAYYDRDVVVHHDQIALSTRAQVGRSRGYAQGFGRLIRKHDYGVGYLGARVGRSLLRGGLCLASGDVEGARRRYGWAVGSLSGYMAPTDATGRRN